jgi:hypothetical protein
MIAEVKYINLLSSLLPKFQRKDENLWNFRCTLCGDSKKNRNKARAYIGFDNGRFSFYCHNCNASMSFSNFLKHMNPNLYNEYLHETFLKGKTKLPLIQKKEREHKEVLGDESIFNGLVRLVNLPSNHPARIYIESRKIPSHKMSELYFCEKFKEFTNSVVENYYENYEIDEERIIIPLTNEFGSITGYQGRSISGGTDRLRYITIMVNKEAPRFYGLENVNFNTTYYVVEGPFDSMFLGNAIATCGGQLLREIQKLNKVLYNCVVVYDNEPRNPDIVRGIKKAINASLKVVIWPQKILDKDINDMILSEIDVTETVVNHTYHGLEAELELSKWSRIGR